MLALCMAEDLYEADFYLWSQRQAEALRSRSHNRLDWEHLAEEVEDLGGSQKRARKAGSPPWTLAINCPMSTAQPPSTR